MHRNLFCDYPPSLYAPSVFVGSSIGGRGILASSPVAYDDQTEKCGRFGHFLT